MRRTRELQGTSHQYLIVIVKRLDSSHKDLAHVQNSVQQLLAEPKTGVFQVNVDLLNYCCRLASEAKRARSAFGATLPKISKCVLWRQLGMDPAVQRQHAVPYTVEWLHSHLRQFIYHICLKTFDGEPSNISTAVGSQLRVFDALQL